MSFRPPSRMTAMELVRADKQVIEGFLTDAAGNAIHLTAIDPRGGSVTARWFGANAVGATDWAAQHNSDGKNIYWSPNVVRQGLNKKARKSDIVAGRYAHVDIDPPKEGGAFDWVSVLADLDSAICPPSFVINSGNGLQAFWRLHEAASEPGEIERINRAIAVHLGGDHCHNIDRLMRLPGTVNLPNAKKVALGRVPVMASVVRSDLGLDYSVVALAAAFPVSDPIAPSEISDLSGRSLDMSGIEIGGELHRLLTEPKGLDRSRDVCAAACEMLRLGFDDAAILGALLDAELPISAHCLDQTDPERAARRAIDRAYTELADDLRELSAQSGLIRATPYAWPAPHTIPPRRWLYGRQLLRGTLAVIVAPGATGKTALTVGMALALATGRPLLGRDVPGGRQRVWLFNLEDARDELDRAIAAACIQHDIRPSDVADRLLVDSGLNGAGLCTAVQTRQGHTILRPVYDGLSAELKTRQIDVLIVDPFVSSHAVPENDNGAIDAVAKAWARIAATLDCSVILVHHTSKSAGMEITAERSRGAVSLVNAARSVVALNRMTADEAQRLGVNESDRRRYFRAYDDKNNRAPPADSSDWYRLESVILPNGIGEDCFGDSVGVVVPWTPPATGAEVLDPVLVAELQKLIADSEWRESERAQHWAGKAVAQALGLDLDNKAERARIKAVLKMCVTNGWLRIEARRDGNREMRSWIVVGELVAPEIDDRSALPSQGDAAVPQPRSTAVRGTTIAVQCRSAPPLGGTAAAALHVNERAGLP